MRSFLTVLLFSSICVEESFQSSRQQSHNRNRRLLESVDSWGPWSSFSKCSSSCGPGFIARYRTCYSRTNYRPQCLGMDKDLRTCNLGPFPGQNRECMDTINYCQSYAISACTEDKYKDWAYNTCPKYCGLCQAKVTAAPTPSVPRVNGDWSPWSSFSSCSSSCGAGSMFRYRQCSNPGPSGGGDKCTGTSTESYGCFIRPCPTTPAPYTAWGSWTNYSTCSVTCGVGEKVRERYRYCTDQSQCKLIGYDRAPCKQTPCPVNGQWSSWNDWSSCSVSCDLGVITRNRSCDNPPPTNGGAGCTGNDANSRECTMGQCPAWSTWFDGDCSASCGNGTRQRLRHCSTGRDIDCTGAAYQMVPCLDAYCI